MRPSPGNSGIPTLTLGQRYALAAVATLARHPRDRYVPVADLAAEASAPGPFLAKVLSALVVAGVLDGRRGHYGGYRLARAPSRIRLHDVVSALATSDEPEDRNPCAMGARACSPRHPCGLHEQWGAALVPLRTLLHDRTVADLVKDAPAEVEPAG